MGNVAARLYALLWDDLLPRWHERGVDATRGGFHNRLLPDGTAAADPSKRVLVQARQTWVFAHAARLGGPAFCLATARQGYAFLVERCRDRERGGFFFTLTPEGAPLDPNKDLYVHAFALLALAEYARATGESEPLDVAGDTFDLVEARLADCAHGGFFDAATRDWTPAVSPRRQNPHMHLLEALLALHAARPDPRWLEVARRIHELLETRFVDRETGTLREHFGEGWEPAAGAVGESVEPGHHYEWVWLLAALEDADPSIRTRARADALFDFAERRGLDTAGGVHDEVDRRGRVVRATQRLWPQLERIQALAARTRMSVPGARAALESALSHVIARYPSQERGLWREHLDAEGRVRSDSHPATSVYHIVAALSDATAALESGPRSPDSRAS